MTNFTANLLTKDLDVFETIEDDAARKISGGLAGLDCTEANRTTLVDSFQSVGVLTAAEATALKAAPLARFCADFDDYIEATQLARS